MKSCLQDSPPTSPNLKSEVLAEIDDCHLLDSLEHLAHIQKQLWPCLKAIFEAHHLLPPTAIVLETRSSCEDTRREF